MEEPERREEQHRFRKGQIVAVRQEEQDRWVPAAYQATVEDDYDRKFKARRLGYATFGVRWRYCVPAQEVWPWMEKLRARIVIEGGCLEHEGEPKVPGLDTACFAQSLKSLVFSIGGTHVAGWVEEAERAAREGRIVKYE